MKRGEENEREKKTTYYTYNECVGVSASPAVLMDVWRCNFWADYAAMIRPINWRVIIWELRRITIAAVRTAAKAALTMQ